jgi:hypothetical protein
MYFFGTTFLLSIFSSVSEYFQFNTVIGTGHAVTQFVEVGLLCCKPEGHWSIPNGVIQFFIDIILPALL